MQLETAPPKEERSSLPLQCQCKMRGFRHSHDEKIPPFHPFGLLCGLFPWQGRPRFDLRGYCDTSISGALAGSAVWAPTSAHQAIQGEWRQWQCRPCQCQCATHSRSASLASKPSSHNMFICHRCPCSDAWHDLTFARSAGGDCLHPLFCSSRT